MDAVFLRVLNMSLTASYVVLFVLAARLLLKKAPKIFSYALWGVVLFRLVCPFSFEGLFSLLLINPKPIPSDITYAEVPQINTGISLVDSAVNPILSAQTAAQGASVNPMQIWIFIGQWIWLAGIAALLIYSIISLLRLRSKLVGAVKWRDNIYLADHIVSPFVMGLLRPKIYLPSTLSEREREYILLHEQTHIRRFDHIIKIVAFLALTVHWFNPMVWLAFFLCVKDMEMSCDEAVIKKMGGDIRADYSASLLSLATGKKIVAGIPLAFGEGDPKSRIKNVLNYKKPAFWIVAAAVVVCIVLAVCLIANPRTEAKEKIDGKTYDTYTSEGITVYVPEECADLVLVDTKVNDEYLHQIIALYYKPAYDAHYGLGLMFSIKCCSYEQMLELLNEAHDGISFKATDGKNYYLYCEPTDAEWNLPEEADEYKEVRDSIIVSYGEFDELSDSDLDTLSTQSDAAEQAQAVINSVVSGGTVAMTLTTDDGVGGGRYEVPLEYGNGRNRVRGFDSSFNWSYVESGTSSSPESVNSLKVESPDGTTALQCWQGSNLVLCTLDGESFRLSAGVLGSDAVFDGTIFTYLRIWYDEAEISGLRGGIVVPDKGQSYQEIAQAWTEAEEGAMLRATPGSKYACTYVKTTASVREDSMDSWYPAKALETEHFYFDYNTVFVPENDRATNWLMAGNTVEYTGRDAPAGALKYYLMGPMYLTEEGWRCDGIGTGP